MRSAVLLALVLTGGCATTVDAGPNFLSGVGPVADFGQAVRDVETQRFAGVVRQRYDFSCGSAALATLLRHHYGSAVGEQETFVGMWQDGDREQIRRVGFSLLDMKRYLAARGMAADGYQVSLDQVADAGVPGVALVTVRDYKHFVVVKGVNAREVLVGDPSVGIHAYPRAEFEAAWNGIYFVINDRQAEGRQAFNRTSSWAAVSRAPIGDRFHDPLSLQALQLTAPGQGDF